MTAVEINKNIQKLKASYHGGKSQKGYTDFSANLNPYPPSPKLKSAFKKSDFTKYPDSSALDLKKQISSRINVELNNILCLNGTSQGILLTALSLLGKNDKSLIMRPCFSEYERASIICGSESIFYDLQEKNNFIPEINKLTEIIRNHKPKTTWLCSPNNPTGTYLSKTFITTVLNELKAFKGVLILDEAYIDFEKTPWNSNKLVKDNNIIILRSLTKNFNIPGLRLGYIAGNTEIIEAISKIQPAWSINSPAIQAGIAGFKALDYYKKTWEKMNINSDNLNTKLIKLGFKVINSSGNFIFFKNNLMPDLIEKLYQKRIIVRDCSSFGLKEYIRIGSRSEKENRKLVKALKEILANN